MVRNLRENNFRFDRFDVPGENPDRVEQFLKENNIVYQTIPATYPGKVFSPDGRFVALPDGIYWIKTGQKIVEGYSAGDSIRGHSGKYFFVQGWMYDGKAVIYSDFVDPCVIETTFIIFDDPYCYFKVPQPLIKLKVPEEYLQLNQ